MKKKSSDFHIFNLTFPSHLNSFFHSLSISKKGAAHSLLVERVTWEKSSELDILKFGFLFCYKKAGYSTP